MMRVRLVRDFATRALWAAGGILLVVSLLPQPAGGATAEVAPPGGSPASSALPVIAGKQAVASVNGEPITIDDVLRQVGSMHAGVAEPAAKVHKPDPSALLDRIINVRLILQEARKIGLDRQPEFAATVESIRTSLIRGTLVRQQVRDITEGDPAAVEALYRDMVRAMVLDSLLFSDEKDARVLLAAVRAGGDFGALARAAVAEGKARGGEGARSMKAAEMRPEVGAVVTAMKPGAVSDPIRLTEGWSIVRLIEVRYPEDAEARQKAAAMALQSRQDARLEAYRDDLRKRYTQVDPSILKSLDYEAKEPGLEALRRDTRVVARIRGGRPVTVKELTEAVEKKFYHGVSGAIERKRVHEDLPQILDRVMLERVILLEAKRLKIERSDEFKASFKEQTDGQLFEAFLRKVIDPEVKLDEAELRKHYADSPAEYTSPEMMRIEGLAFQRESDAGAALARLRKGADLKWMRANADGQADRETFPGLLEFNGGLLAIPTLPEGARKALAGASAGDCRLYATPEGPHYVLCVRQVVPPQRQPFDEVKRDIATRVYARKRQAVIEDWADKLRAASAVKVFATDAALREILGLGAAGGA